MIDCISRDSVCLNKHVFYHPKDGIARNNGYDPADWAIRISDVMDVPTADVVARDAFNRILAENDTMREQLAQIGKKPGDKMEDVRPVVLCRDCVYYNTTGCADGFGWCEGVMVSKGTSDDFFCAEGKQNPYECGAEMERNLDTTKGDQL